MRQLAAKGYVHQRAAICAASFLCFDLGLDWRIGSQVWMERLISADQAICDGNWQWIAGTGSDQAAYPRIYNPRKQARFIDPQGVYIRRWVRELAKLPTRATLEPWELSRQQQTELGFFTPEQYPPPIVDHETAARAMLEKYQSYRQRG
jgi:deoxyribodipyrimidine photo-lyase